MEVHSFDPIAGPVSRLLILGSMPGKASLQAGEYYAHPRNLFWRFIEEMLGVPRTARYSDRVTQLTERGVAVWDVLKTCTRETSLDSDIVSSSIIPNDFGAFFDAHPEIATVCFNGVKAADLFQRHVQPHVAHCDRLAFHRLPSTSPANASIPLEKKLEAWTVIRRED